jgi:formamidopyrimidine-DNA glycosylase
VPELHGVEGFRLGLAGILRDTTARALARRLDGQRLAAPRRHGNWLILPADGPAPLIHSARRVTYCSWSGFGPE